MNKLGDPADAWNTREEPVEEWVARWNPKGAYMLHHFDNGMSSHVVRMGRMCTYHKSTLRKLLSRATEKDVVLAAWPGQWRQDVFLVDDLQAARDALR